jgi:hypothetical protein
MKRMDDMSERSSRLGESLLRINNGWARALVVALLVCLALWWFGVL